MLNFLEQSKRRDEIIFGTAKSILSFMIQEMNLPRNCISISSFSRHLKKTCKLSYKTIQYPKPLIDTPMTKDQRYNFVR
jgi:hypothetical protein